MNHNVVMWLLTHLGKKFAPIEWAEKCNLSGIKWEKWDLVTLHPADCYVTIETFVYDYQRYSIADR